MSMANRNATKGLNLAQGGTPELYQKITVQRHWK